METDRTATLAEATRQVRAVREELERAVLSLATSLDGRRFSLQASLHELELEVGGYVALDHGGRPALGQLVELEIARVEAPDLGVADAPRVQLRAAKGEGVLLDDVGPFHDVRARPASAEEVAAWFASWRSERAVLSVGELAAPGETPAALDARGFGRHTFVCGQSGSGKTYSLGVVLERLLAETSLRVIVLDPNSDYRRLAALRPDADPGEAKRYARAAEGITVRGGAPGGTERLRLRFADLEPATQAALLGLDPIADRAEYAELLALTETSRVSLRSLVDVMAESDGEATEALGQRARNLGLLGWAIWARDDAGSLLDELGPEGPRCLVVDLGSLGEREEQALVAETVLGELWRRRSERSPVLLVVDEAHNVCPQTPDDPLTERATEHAIRIAGEGRKFGIYLLVATQRPQKVHENVLSQCDNLLLMRMNSEADLGVVRGAFSFVPPGLLARATSFRQGEALVAGLLAPHPMLVRFGRRVSEEGGADVPSDWARARG